MLPLNKALIVILVIALATFLTRVLPFLVFPGNKKTPAITGTMLSPIGERFQEIMLYLCKNSL